MNEQMKDRIEDLVGVYVGFLYSTDREAGWHQPSQTEWCKDKNNKKVPSFRKKQLTAGFAADDSGGSTRLPEDKMLMETSFLRKQSSRLPLAKWLLGEVALKHEKYYAALIAERWYQTVYKATQTDRDCAARMGINLRQYRHNKKLAMLKAQELLESEDRKKEYQREVA
ncbi:hypothetical protein [Neptuniibacter halophilus]|uniref:hypothetical protein n=1 Tax=Neptuniibacter halophilus TaxID=651666 RepID=UPI00257460EB|nr:hypothetical protein [Neptuniibacter halophilus]